jgi:uncharacterized protein (DUF2141 family)
VAGSRLTGIILLAVLSFICSGCALLELRKQSDAIGSLRCIEGTVKRATGKQGQLYVLLFREELSTVRLIYQAAAGSTGSYRLWCPPGTYYVAAFIDTNNDGVIQKDEPWSYYGMPTPVHVAGETTISLDPLTIFDLSPVLDPSVKVDVKLRLYANVGKVGTLQNPLFNPENCAMGMWRPDDFLNKIGGGLFFLQEFENGKIPVIFIHGINGGPTDFRSLIETMDTTRYQPVVLYYPSGVSLGIISDFFESAIVAVQERYGFKKFAMIGHSMGGLVTRSIVKKYVENNPDRADNLAFVMTINSPLGGMPSAEFGATSPILVQSWLDIIPGSTFLKEVDDWSWPSSIPYYLIFSFGQGNSDGVVPLPQQLPLKPQQEAVHVYGFNDSHVGTLHNPSFIQTFRSILESGDVL